MSKKSSSFGLKRLCLAGSANYSFAVVPLDKPLSISGSNNMGKSTLLGALQWLIFASGGSSAAKSLNFGAHDLKTSREYYFPTGSSYILLEVALPTGTYIIGAHGKGPTSGFEYDLFVCKSELNTDDLLDDNRIISYRELFARWGSAGKDYFGVSRDEMRQLLYGEYIKVKNGRFDITLFPLANSSEKRFGTFRQIYRNLLTQTVLKSRDLKDLLLSVFEEKIVASQTSVNFTTVRKEAFREWALQADEIKSLEARRADILSLHQETLSRRDKREEGAILTRQLKVNVERSVLAYPVAIQNRRDVLTGVQDRKERLTRQYSENTRLLNELNRSKGQFDSLSNELASLKQRVSLSTREQVETNLKAVQRELIELESSLGQSDRFNADVLGKQLEAAQNTLQRLERELDTLKEGDGLGHALGLEPEQVSELSRILNPAIFRLPKHCLKEQTRGNFKDFLLAHLLPEDGVVVRNGFRLDLSSISETEFGLDKIPELEMQILMQKQSIDGIAKNLEIARDQKGTQEKIDRLAREAKSLNSAVSDYDRLSDLEEQYLNAKEEVVILELKIEDVMVAINDYAPKLEAISAEAALAAKEFETLSRKLQDVRAIQRVVPLRQNFFGLAEGDDADFELDLAEADIQEIADRLASLEMGVKSIDLNIGASQQRILDELSQLSEFIESENLPDKAKEMLDALPQKRDWLARLHDHAVIKVSSCLHDLSTNFLQLEHEVTLFNRQVNGRKVSNIRRFSIDLVRNNVLLESIDTLLQHLSNTQANAADLFGGSGTEAVPDNELRRALDRLSRVVEDGRDGNLEVADLFDLQFTIVDAKGKESVSEKLDQLSSFGSTMTQKPLLYMNLLRHLADRKYKAEIALPFYIDEANCIDTKNQETIIGYCADLGFTPVFASVQSTLTASVGVNLSECVMDDSRLVITEQDWMHFNHAEVEQEEDQMDMLA